METRLSPADDGLVIPKTLTLIVLTALLVTAAPGSAKSPHHATTLAKVPATNVTLPSISGTPAVGSTLTGNKGTWSSTTTGYALQWLRCGTSCQAITRATASTYTIAAADAGSSLRLQVVASNSGGSTLADSAATPRVPLLDTEAPTAPSSPTVEQTTSTSIGIAWAASTDNIGVSGYDVYENGARVSTTVGLTENLSGLSCGTSYVLAIDAYDAAGNRSGTTSISADTSSCVAAAPPSQPLPASAPSSPPPGAGQIYWGAYIDGTQTYSNLYGGTWSNGPWCDPGTQCPLARFEQNVGKGPSIEHYGEPAPWQQGFDTGAANLVQGRGNISAIDMSTGTTSLSAIANGTYDSSITAWAQGAKAFGHPFFLLLDEEMNGNWYGYSPGQNGNTAAAFVAAWRHIHDIFTQVGATNVTWVWCPNVDLDGSLAPLSSLYPGDAYVDWTGLNGYNWGGTKWMSFSAVFSRSYNALLQLAPSKPIMIGETASAEAGGSKAAWITDALTVQLPLNFPQIKAVLWFNWRIFENNAWQPWEIESSTTSQLAFSTAVNLPYYAPGGSFGNLPLLSKVQPLPSP